jgi:hypothetical protein
MPWYDLKSFTKFRRPMLSHMLPVAGVLALLALLVFNTKASAQTGINDVLPLDQLDTPTDDLIRLSTDYADALREYKVAKLSIDTVTTLRPNAVITNLEVQIAQLNLEAAERKRNMLRLIVQKRLAAAENKLRILKFLTGEPARAGEGPKGMDFLLTNAEATVEILRAILAMN